MRIITPELKHIVTVEEKEARENLWYNIPIILFIATPVVYLIVALLRK